MKKTRIGIAGIGFMGTTHFRIWRGLEDAEIGAICDVDPVKLAGDVSTVVGNIGGGDNSKPLDLSGVKAYSTASEMIADTSLEIIDICAPTPDHSSIAMAALEAKKHVFCEKPVCRSLRELDELSEAVKRGKSYFNVGMCIRAWPEYYHARTLYKDGKFGRIRSAFFRRLSPDITGNSWKNWFMDGELSGGALLDLHLHDTDFIRFMFGRPKAVTSFGVNSVRSRGGTDHIITNYHFDDCLIAAEGGWCANKKVPFEMSFQMIFERATVRFAGEGYQIYWEDGEVESPQVADKNLPTGWHRELSYFLNCVRDDVSPDKYQDFNEITDSFNIVMAEQESVDSGKTVEIKYRG
ncbi:MAG: Gfo/Idh/MocA family oxidoreductase [Victivallales bacterium]|nr:Gfo/Idh/MocA family oxidoreductase [Victivallales bacterium]